MSTFNARSATIVLFVTALGGCGPTASDNLSDAAVNTGSAATALTLLRPGQWEATATEPQVDRPFGSAPLDTPTPRETPAPRRFCLSPADAADPSPELLMGNTNRNECKRSSWTMRNGDIDGDMVCVGHAEDIREVPTRISGSYSRDSYRITTEIKALGMTLRQDIEAHRVGDCS